MNLDFIENDSCNHSFEARPFEDLWHCRRCSMDVLGLPRNPHGHHQDERRERETACDHDRLHFEREWWRCPDCGGMWREEPT